MNTVTLTRDTNKDTGIFGTLVIPGKASYQTLEHAYYDSILCVYRPKLPPGTYKCVRGMHQLSHGSPFATFEITGVPGHKGILFHVGNFNGDSEGCVLLGMTRTATSVGASRDAFNDFMGHFVGVDEFTLEVH